MKIFLAADAAGRWPMYQIACLSVRSCLFTPVFPEDLTSEGVVAETP